MYGNTKLTIMPILPILCICEKPDYIPTPQTLPPQSSYISKGVNFYHETIMK